MDYSPPKIAVDQKHARTGACHGDRKISCHGGLSLTRTRAGDKKTFGSLPLSAHEKERRPNITKRFGVQVLSTIKQKKISSLSSPWRILEWNLTQDRFIEMIS
jgi:hypothetical protein